MTAPHLDDDTLSASLDNVRGTPEDQVHLAGCPDCQARLGQLARVAEALAAPVSARSPGEVSAAIARAVATRSSVTAEVPPIRARGHAPARRWLAAAVGTAAAVALVTGVAVVLSRSGSRSNETTAASAGVASSQAAPPQAALQGGDLGEQSDPNQLARLLTARLGGPGAAPSARVAPGAGVAPSAGGPLSSAGPANPSIEAEPPCVGPALRAAGLPGERRSAMVLVAPLHWRGRAALVFVFDRSTPPGGRAGVVMGSPDCGLLVTLPM